MSHHYRLAVLLCDTPMAAVIAAHGNYHSIFDALMKASAPEGVTYELTAYDVVDKMVYPPADAELDGVLLTGSAASAYENLEWINRLVEWTAAFIRDKPKAKVFGICFGHQIIGRALGGECVPNEGKWEVGTTTIDLSDVGQKLFGTSTLNIQQMHRDHVPAVPKPLHLLGSTSIADNQGMVLLQEDKSVDTLEPADVHVLTLQGHPEFTTSISDLVIAARTSTGVFPKDLAEEAHKRNKELRNDGVEIIGRLMWKVLGA